MSYRINPPHIRSTIKNIRSSGYTFARALSDLADNTITKSKQLNIELCFDSNDLLYEIKIEDDYIHGFENIECEGELNPFNMGHVRPGHENNSETSEFGIGMKSSVISLCNKWNIYTKVHNK